MVNQVNGGREHDVPLTEEQVRAIFKKHDKNKDNQLSNAELKAAFAELGALFPSWRAWRGLAVADSNGDGFISEDELNKLVHYAHSLGYKVH